MEYVDNPVGSSYFMIVSVVRFLSCRNYFLQFFGFLS